MRAGISRVVVEIIILVIAVALALLIFSPISGYIFGSLGRTATVGGAAQIQILNANISKDNTGTYNSWTIYVKNLGPGSVAYKSESDFTVYIDGNPCGNLKAYNYTSGGSWTEITTSGTWSKEETIKVTCTFSTDQTKQHNIVLYGPGGTQAQYLYYPPPS